MLHMIMIMMEPVEIPELCDTDQNDFPVNPRYTRNPIGIE